jgi:HAE1 family hydrophobic/amphiphilic exporter-1
VVGILVDDAIVVLENIYRHMEMGKSKIRAAYDGASEIGFTVAAITLVIVVVFLPIAMSSGLVANIWHSSASRWLLQHCYHCWLHLPLFLGYHQDLVSLEHLTGKNWFEKFILWFEGLIDKFTHWITGILEWCLKTLKKNFYSVITFIILISSFSLVIFGFIGGEFFPPIDRGQFWFRWNYQKMQPLRKPTNYIRS